LWPHYTTHHSTRFRKDSTVQLCFDKFLNLFTEVIWSQKSAPIITG
jgi:hypothetical protein